MIFDVALRYEGLAGATGHADLSRGQALNVEAVVHRRDRLCLLRQWHEGRASHSAPLVQDRVPVDGRFAEPRQVDPPALALEALQRLFDVIARLRLAGVNPNQACAPDSGRVL